MRDRLKTLMQTKSVYRYLNAFKSLALRISDTSQAKLLHAFIWELKDRVKAELCLRNPSMYAKAARMALDIDKYLHPLYHYAPPSRYPTHQP